MSHETQPDPETSQGWQTAASKANKQTNFRLEISSHDPLSIRPPSTKDAKLFRTSALQAPSRSTISHQVRLTQPVIGVTLYPP